MRSLMLTLSMLMFVAAVAAAEDKPKDTKGEKKAEKVKTVEVKIDRGGKTLLTLNVPETWKQEKPKSNLRLAQFVIPKAKDDEEGGVLALFNFGAGGGVQANIDRWVGQFQPEEREVEISKGEIEKGQYYIVEISGTYNKPIGPPVRRQSEPTPGSRMLGVILGIEEKGIFFFKMTGPDKTVAKERKTLRASFGGDIEKEEAVKQEESS